MLIVRCRNIKILNVKTTLLAAVTAKVMKLSLIFRKI